MNFIRKIFGRLNEPRPTDETRWIPKKIYKKTKKGNRIILVKKYRKFYIPDREEYEWLPETYKNAKGEVKTVQRLAVRKAK